MTGYFNDDASDAAFEKRRKEWVAAHEDTASLLASKDARIAELERKLASAVEDDAFWLKHWRARAEAAEQSALTAKRDGMIEAAGWRSMDSAPRGVPIECRHRGWVEPGPYSAAGQWVGTVVLDPTPDEDDGRGPAGDTIVHYNGTALIRGFHGVWDGWRPLPADAPHTETRGDG